jgi:hypothetical protein
MKQLIEINMNSKLFPVLLATVILRLFTGDAQAQLSVNTLTTSGLNEPYSLAEDAAGDLYFADSGNDQIVMLNINNQAQSVFAGLTSNPGAVDGPSYAAQFNDPQGLLAVTIGGVPGLLVTDSGNCRIRFVRFSDGYVTTLAGNTNGTPVDSAVGTSATFRQPIGLTQDGNGNVFISDFNAIRVMNLADPNFGITTLNIGNTSFNKPTAVAYGNTNQLWVADTGNNTVKLITLTSSTSGTMTSYLGSLSSRSSGTTDSTLGSKALFYQPSGLLWDPNIGLLISDTGNDTIRLATNNPAYGASNYSVTTFAGIARTAGHVDGTATTAEFSMPCGMIQDGFQSYFLADLKNNVIRSIQYGTRDFTPVGTPTIGYVTIVIDVNTGVATAVFNTDLPKVFNNDPNIQIIDPDTNGSPAIEYTTGSSTANFADPSQTNGTLLYPPYLNDGIPSDVPPSIIASANIIPSMTIKALGVSYGSGNRRPPSPLVYGEFQFITATIYNQSVNVNDPQHIYLTNATVGSVIYYTKDGSDPATNNKAVKLQSPFGSALPVNDSDYDTNGTFTLRAIAERGGYYNSPPFSEVFYKSNSLYSVNISFGFPSGEASSSFVASPGQTFYAPVTLTLTTNTTIYSLQFNVTVTNQSASTPRVAPGAYGFDSFLTKPLPDNPALFEVIPPLMAAGYAAPPYYPLTPPSDVMVTYDKSNFVSLLTYNTSLNLISVGWLERMGDKTLYDTTKQTLITYSQDHDVTFLAASGQVVVGSYTFQVPGNAVSNQTYQIQIGRPSATSDGIGAPGSDVTINAPTNGSFASGSINAVKNVTVGQRTYVAGDVYPFQWFNAGDFGDGVLDNADVEQVFEAAVYSLNTPPAGSDFFDAMDSCGYIGMLNGSGVYTNAGSYSTNYPAPNFLVSSNYVFTYGYSNVFLFTNITTYSNAIDVVNLTTNTYLLTANYSKNYTSPIITNTVATGVSFVYVDPTAGTSTYTTNSVDIFYAFTNTLYYTNTVVVSNTYYLSNNIVLLVTNQSSSTNIGTAGNNDAPQYVFTTEPAEPFTVYNYNINALFSGNDTTINTVVFGDGQLDVCDVYVTFRRSLDPSLTWFERYWNQGQRVAVPVKNSISKVVAQPLKASPKASQQSLVSTPAPSASPQVIFVAQDVIGGAGQTVQVPITASVLGDYPLRVLALNVSVNPLDGAPALTTAVQFIPNPALGTPAIVDSQGNQNFAAAWLDSTIAGLTNTADLGTLVVTIPATAGATAAYAVSFDHASASPNGLASFPNTKMTGLLTTSALTNSTYGDGIPDSWRLRWFGTVNNLLSTSNACPSGDGVPNWEKYAAGVDPNVANDFPSLLTKSTVASTSGTAIHWPTVNGVQYVIQRATSLFNGPWSILSTNTGTGGDMEFDDTCTANTKFYRVEILPAP